MHDIDWSQSHNGVICCSFEKTKELMPEVAPILEELEASGKLELPVEDYVVDVKVHMLMPGQYPCIPGWHHDFVPRDENLELQFEKITGEKMFMWLSGAPLTQYLTPGGTLYTKPAQRWTTFTQNHPHRGVSSREHCWRAFIRVVPKKFVPARLKNREMIRRHSQVYLDKDFTW